MAGLTHTDAMMRNLKDFAEEAFERKVAARMEPYEVSYASLTAARIRSGTCAPRPGHRLQLPWLPADNKMLSFDTAKAGADALVVAVLADVGRLLRGVPGSAAEVEVWDSRRAHRFHLTATSQGPAQPRFVPPNPLDRCTVATFAAYRLHTEENRKALVSSLYFDLNEWNL